jgi:hypothetical protein
MADQWLISERMHDSVHRGLVAKFHGLLVAKFMEDGSAKFMNE